MPSEYYEAILVAVVLGVGAAIAFGFSALVVNLFSGWFKE